MKKKTKITRWQDHDPPPANSIVQTMHVEGITYQRKFIACGKERCRKGCADGRPSHGPYWYAMHWNAKTGKTKAVYVGKNEPSLTQISNHVTEED